MVKYLHQSENVVQTQHVRWDTIATQQRQQWKINSNEQNLHHSYLAKLSFVFVTYKMYYQYSLIL